MIKKLPKWVEIGGFTLAAMAGFINAIGLLGFKHHAVSHLTGTTTFFSLELARGNISIAGHLLIIIASFFIGSTISGYIIGNSVLKLGRRYSVALLIEALLLLFSMVLLIKNRETGHYFASIACGLQNAMTSTFSGAIIRTTHLSGLFTDLGIALGLRLRGLKSDMRQILLHITLIGGFVGGGILGTLCFDRIQFMAMLDCWIRGIYPIQRLKTFLDRL